MSDEDKKTPTLYRLPESTRKRIAALAKEWDCTNTEVIVRTFVKPTKFKPAPQLIPARSLMPLRDRVPIYKPNGKI